MQVSIQQFQAGAPDPAFLNSSRDHTLSRKMLESVLPSFQPGRLACPWPRAGTRLPLSLLLAARGPCSRPWIRS